MLLAAAPAGCYVETGPAEPDPAYAPAPAAEPVVYEAPPAPPPAPVAEPIPASPGPEYYYVQGYQRWDGHRYQWTRGHYERRPRANARYVAAHWEPRGRGRVWVEGHWQ
jgi:hypothetical protein